MTEVATTPEDVTSNNASSGNFRCSRSDSYPGDDATHEVVMLHSAKKLTKRQRLAWDHLIHETGDVVENRR